MSSASSLPPPPPGLPPGSPAPPDGLPGASPNAPSFNITSGSNGPGLDTPAGIAPPGVQSNLLSPYRDTATPFAVGSVCVGLMLCLTACRAYSKIRLVRRVWWDDFAYLIGVLGTLTAFAAMIIANTAGVQGFHTWDITLRRASADINNIANYILLVGYVFGSAGIKAACLLMYWQLFSHLPWMRWALRIGGGLLLAADFAVGLALIAIFTPSPSETWSTHVLIGSFEFSINGFLAVTVLSLGTDVFILLLPISAVLGLNMRWRRRIGILIVFMAGTLACVASALNVYFRKELFSSSDITFLFSRVSTVTLVELAVGACCACVPATANVLNSFSFFRELQSLVSVGIASLLGSTVRKDVTVGTTYVGGDDPNNAYRSTAIRQTESPRPAATAHLKQYDIPDSPDGDGDKEMG